MKTIGLFILILGLVMSFYTGFSFVTKEKVVDLGNIQISKDNQHAIFWEPYVGIGLVIIGGALFLVGRKRSMML